MTTNITIKSTHMKTFYKPFKILNLIIMFTLLKGKELKIGTLVLRRTSFVLKTLFIQT